MGMRTGGKKDSAADVEEEDSHGCEWYRRSWNPTLYFPCNLARSIAPGTFSTNSKLAAIAAKSSRPTRLSKKELCLLALLEGGREFVLESVFGGFGELVLQEKKKKLLLRLGRNVGLLCTGRTHSARNGSGDFAVLRCIHCATPCAMDCGLCLVLHHLHHHPCSCWHLDCKKNHSSPSPLSPSPLPPVSLQFPFSAVPISLCNSLLCRPHISAIPFSDAPLSLCGIPFSAAHICFCNCLLCCAPSLSLSLCPHSLLWRFFHFANLVDGIVYAFVENSCL